MKHVDKLHNRAEFSSELSQLIKRYFGKVDIATISTDAKGVLADAASETDGTLELGSEQELSPVAYET